MQSSIHIRALNDGLEAVFAKHTAALHKTGRWNLFALQMTECAVDGSSYFGLSDEMTQLKRVETLLNQAMCAIEELDASTKRKLSARIAPVGAYGLAYVLGVDTALNATIQKFVNAAEELRRDTGKTFSDPPKTGRPTNWPAAALAHFCRTLWGLNHVDAEHSKWKDFEKNFQNGEFGSPLANPVDAFLISLPRTQKADAPGPLGRFVEEVLDFYGIKGSAQSAFRAIPQWAFAEPFLPATKISREAREI